MPRHHTTLNALCQQCGRPFFAFAYRLKKGQSLFCSRKCNGLALANQPFSVTYEANVIRQEGCWGWKGRTDARGYGAMCYRVRLLHAHRFSWELHRCPIPEGQCVLHSCDNPPCSNPDHLFLGTRGETSPKARLTEAIVADLRRRYAAGEINRYNPAGVSIKALAAQLGIGPKSLAAVLHGKSWRHVL